MCIRVQVALLPLMDLIINVCLIVPILLGEMPTTIGPVSPAVHIPQVLKPMVKIRRDFVFPLVLILLSVLLLLPYLYACTYVRQGLLVCLVTLILTCVLISAHGLIMVILLAIEHVWKSALITILPRIKLLLVLIVILGYVQQGALMDGVII